MRSCGFVLHDGYLFLGHKLCIPRISFREFLVWELHVDGLARHFENETVEYRFYWPSLKCVVANPIGRCHICQLAK